MDPRRFPTLLLALVAVIVQVVSDFAFPLTTDQQALVNAVAVAVAGVLTAWATKGDALVAAIVGVAQALVAAMLGFGLALTPDTQTAVMALVTALAAAFVHTQVTAPVPALIPGPGTDPGPGAIPGGDPGGLALEHEPRHESHADSRTESFPRSDAGPWRRARP